MTGITYIGSTLSVAWTAPDDFDETAAADFAALEYAEIGGVVSMGEVGDTAEDVSYNLLKGGRTKHVNGVRDVGDIAVAAEYDEQDAGQIVVEEAANTNDKHYWKIEDPDGAVTYFVGLAANLTNTERNPSSYKGIEFVIRTQSGLVYA